MHKTLSKQFVEEKKNFRIAVRATGEVVLLSEEPVVIHFAVVRDDAFFARTPHGLIAFRAGIQDREARMPQGNPILCDPFLMVGTAVSQRFRHRADALLILPGEAGNTTHATERGYANGGSGDTRILTNVWSLMPYNSLLCSGRDGHPKTPAD